MRTLVVLIIMVLISAVALTLGAENDQLLQVNYLLARGEFHLSSLLIAWFFAGFLLACLLLGLGYLKAKWQIRRLLRRLQRQEKAQQQVQVPATRE